jgi:hypothetical protein
MSESYEGRVVRKRVAEGSKSDHAAVVLQTGDSELVLRRQGGNAFQDDVLDGLVGHRIRGVGRRSGTTLILSEWDDLESAAGSPTKR